MATFNATVKVMLELSAQFEVEAKDETAAEAKAQKIAEGLLVAWEGKKPSNVPDVEWEEVDQTAEVESVEEV
jgi:hypothetical protein